MFWFFVLVRSRIFLRPWLLGSSISWQWSSASANSEATGTFMSSALAVNRRFFSIKLAWSYRKDDSQLRKGVHVPAVSLLVWNDLGPRIRRGSKDGTKVWAMRILKQIQLQRSDGLVGESCNFGSDLDWFHEQQAGVVIISELLILAEARSVKSAWAFSVQ